MHKYLEKRDAVLHAEGCDELLVHGLVTVLTEDAEQRLPLVQRLQQDAFNASPQAVFRIRYISGTDPDADPRERTSD
jgi:hypothetical protein